MSNTTVLEERSFQTKKQLYYEDTQSDGYRKPTFESYPGKPFYTFPHLPQDLSTPDLYTQPPAASVNYAQSYVPQPQQQYLATPNPYIITAPTGSYGASNPVYGSPQHSYSSQKPTNLGYYDAYVVPPAESTYDSYEPSYQGGGYEDEYSGGYGYNKGYKHPYKSYPDVEGMKKYFLFKVYGSLVKAKGALLIGVGKILKLKGKILLAKGEALEDIGYYLKDVKFNTYMSDPYGYGHEDDILEDLIEKGHKHKGYKKSKKANGFKKPKKSYGISKGPPYVHEDSYYKRRKSGIGNVK
ncbi:hypothetical protein QYM36_000634 [Artemia franciscana]|uniref:Uncharacterized protein n=1 Tax=Artemia franciscana TaxID=6661 RepID=A0AA88IDE3_ARTSF|nr:hypothetical protein QYM36_000634 [Artemia franciscana]